MDMNIRTMAQWLVRNERQQAAESQRPAFPETDEAWEPYDTMAGIYINKLEEMADVHLYSVNDVEMSFRICLGSPKIHGRRVMRLPEISLAFVTTGISSTRVYFHFSDRTDEFQEIRTIYKHFMGDDELRNCLSTSCHPHIAADGMPCLGDFSQPWAQTFASNDLPMLINVAKSFLNNWTVRDAYWNINNLNRKWQDYAKDRGISFKHFMMYAQVLDRLSQHINNTRTFSTAGVMRRLTGSHLIQQGEAKGMDLLDVWAALLINGLHTRTIWDKPANKWEQIKNGLHRWQRVFHEITNKAHTAVINYTEHSMNLLALTEDVIHNTHYLERHSIDRRIDVPDSMWNLFKDGVTYVIKDIQHIIEENFNINTLHMMLHRVNNDESIGDDEIWLTEEQVDYQLGAYFSREWFTDHHQARARGFVAAVRLMLERYPEGFRSDISGDDLTEFVKYATDLKYGERKAQRTSMEIDTLIGNKFYNLLDKLFDNPEWEEETIEQRIYPDVAGCVMMLVEDYYKSKAKRISNGRAKFERTVGHYSDTYDGENQIPAS